MLDGEFINRGKHLRQVTNLILLSCTRQTKRSICIDCIGQALRYFLTIVRAFVAYAEGGEF